MAIAATKAPGTWTGEVRRSRSSLLSVTRYWRGLYGKALLDRNAQNMMSASRPDLDTAPEPVEGKNCPGVGQPSMCDDVESKATDQHTLE